MSTRRLYSALAVLILVIGLFVAHAWRQNNGIAALTSDIRNTYNLPAADALFPIASLDEVIPEGSSPEEVVRKLQPLKDRVASERWVRGNDVGGSPFTAHIIALKLSGGGTYSVAFVYRKGTLWDIDTPEYLGRTAEFPGDSGQVWLSRGAT
jgi:hypothetical protein